MILRATACLAALGAVNLIAPHLPAPSRGAQIAALALVSFPLATLFVASIAPTTLPAPKLLAIAVAAAALTAGLIAAGLEGTPATLSKLVAAACIGIALAGLLQTPAEIVAISVLIAGVDAYSVAAGPTHAIVLHHQQVLGAFTLAFHPPGTYAVAQIGASDFVFFALFSAASVRMGLRVRATWVATTASLGATMALSYVFDTALPALPLLSLAFLGANADLLLERTRGRRGSPERESGAGP
ncbi:MAG TPA: hypothetical protein VFW14_15635 [Gaiellales bacterium]|nr:hypothetical protein [Gaiellales bacterium]